MGVVGGDRPRDGTLGSDPGSGGKDFPAAYFLRRGGALPFGRPSFATGENGGRSLGRAGGQFGIGLGQRYVGAKRLGEGALLFYRAQPGTGLLQSVAGQMAGRRAGLAKYLCENGEEGRGGTGDRALF